MKPLTLLLAGCMLAGCAQRAATANDGQIPDGTLDEGLPLERGYFVRQGTPCGNASNASLTTHTGSGINAAQAFCDFTHIEKTGDSTYSVTEECTYIRGGGDSRELEITVDGRTSYSLRAEDGWTYSARYCPQESLPEPWRSNDLSRILK